MPSWIIVLILLIAAVIGSIYSIIKDKRQGKCSCGHKCGACASCACCAAKNKKKCI